MLSHLAQSPKIKEDCSRFLQRVLFIVVSPVYSSESNVCLSSQIFYALLHYYVLTQIVLSSCLLTTYYQTIADSSYSPTQCL